MRKALYILGQLNDTDVEWLAGFDNAHVVGRRRGHATIPSAANGQAV